MFVDTVPGISDGEDALVIRFLLVTIVTSATLLAIDETAVSPRSAGGAVQGFPDIALRNQAAGEPGPARNLLWRQTLIRRCSDFTAKVGPPRVNLSFAEQVSLHSKFRWIAMFTLSFLAADNR